MRGNPSILSVPSTTWSVMTISTLRIIRRGHAYYQKTCEILKRFEEDWLVNADITENFESDGNVRIALKKTT